MVTLDKNINYLLYIMLNHVELYVDDEQKSNFSSEPFVWLWSERAFGKHSLKAVAYDNAGNSASAEMVVWKLF